MTAATEILDKALELADTRSWESIRLYDIATELKISLDEIRQHYSQKDDLAEAWFNRADQAMLSEASRPEFNALSGKKKIHFLIIAWLTALSSHRQATKDMLKYKLEPGHIHLQASGLIRLSRTVQWLLEAVGSKTVNLARISEEIGTTGVFLTTFFYWLTDNSEEYINTAKKLDSFLNKAEKLAKVVNPTSVVAQSGDNQE